MTLGLTKVMMAKFKILHCNNTVSFSLDLYYYDEKAGTAWWEVRQTLNQIPLSKVMNNITPHMILPEFMHTVHCLIWVWAGSEGSGLHFSTCALFIGLWPGLLSMNKINLQLASHSYASTR